MEKFSKKDRSTWPYFWAHWFAFQMVAVTLGVWKFRYLFHDWYKPWLKMFGVNYKTIQTFHRYNSDHHIEYFEYNNDPHKFDWDELIVDWECSQYTKANYPRGARDEMEHIISNNINDVFLIYMLNIHMRPRLKELGL